ncbi:MAG: hypothetical protein H6813_00825 [Phycisphaeraceae bacterium]|nr:hypothetical protein [Phycisphaeraceae bacterium]MCB9847371.1 hypothetical protein [Phycisphaeraceae bacterium]
MRHTRLIRSAAPALAAALLALHLSSPGAGADVRGGAGVLDVEIIQATDPMKWGREGVYPNGRMGLGILTTSRNVGTVNVDWFQAGFPGETLDNRHPFIGQNCYRTRNGRLEQIGLAWIKHGFFSTNDNCADDPGDFLGVGCQDTYGNFTNANRQYLGPRSEINPLTGYWEPCGSHFDTGMVGYPAGDPGDCVMTHFSNFAPHDNDDHRLRISDADILGATSFNKFYLEGFYIVAGDENIENNWGYRQYFFIEPGVDPDWTFQPITAFKQNPVIDDWGDDSVTASPTTEGKVRVAVRVVPIDATHNRFEYNIYNMNLDRQIGSFSVPIGPGVTITDFGFHAPVEDEEPLFATGDWTPTLGPDAITWNAPAPDTNAGESFPNTIRYGTMYTFWFTADSAGGPSVLTLTQFKPGAEGPLAAALIAPCSFIADLNGDGVVDTADLGILLGAFGSAGPLGDLNGDMIVDTADLGILLSSFGLDCIAG